MSSHNLTTCLANCLPRNVAVRAYHISTNPTKTDPIFSAAPSQPEQSTYCESHFLVIATPNTPDRGELAILAIEILIFTTPTLTTVFVSKADSTGYASLLQLPPGSASPIKSLVQAFISFLLHPRLSAARVVLSLFARAQDQYLFPGSIDNSEKHVLDDRQLIKWWCRICDTVWRRYADTQSEQTISAHLVIPGLEKSETKAYFPPSSRNDSVHDPKWINDYPVAALAVNNDLPPRCLIPRLPDDPKSRFLTDLDLDHVGQDGHWRTIKTLDQFWEFMSYRQECSAGRLVGFLWIAFLRPEAVNRAMQGSGESTTANDVPYHEPQLPTPGDSQQQRGQPYAPPALGGLAEIIQEHSPPPSSPLLAPIDDEDLASAQQVEMTGLPVPDNGDNLNEAVKRSSTADCLDGQPRFLETRGQIVTDGDTYEGLIDALLELDFTGQAAAAQSTAKWVSTVLERTGKDSFGLDIVGSLDREIITTRTVADEGIPPPVATMLMGVRKKRKPEATALPEEPAAAPQTNVLSASLMRKKPKIDKTA